MPITRKPKLSCNRDPQQKNKSDLSERNRNKSHACFLALDRAADSLFLIMRLKRLSLELLSESDTLLCPDPDRNASNRVAGGDPSKMEDEILEELELLKQ